MCVSYLCEIVAREKLKVKPVIDIQSAAALLSSISISLTSATAASVDPKGQYPQAVAGKHDSSNIAARLHNTELDNVFMTAPRKRAPLLFGYHDVEPRGRDDLTQARTTTCGRPKP